jgi:hypothetical protein
MSVVDSSFDQPLLLEEHAVMPLAGGIMQHGYQCGMVWGAVLAAGAQAYRIFGASPQAEAMAIVASQRIVDSFCACNKYINCSEITELDWKPKSKKGQSMKILKFFLKGGPIGCFSMAARYAPLAFDEINKAFANTSIEIPSSLVSCSALLAQKMGVSDMHRIMVSGFAGGIGLSSGGCGALGAAIWLYSITSQKGGAMKIDYADPKALEIVERFLVASDYEFECAKIVGRKFENVNDHAAYIQSGGCGKVIEALAI